MRRFWSAVAVVGLGAGAAVAVAAHVHRAGESTADGGARLARDAGMATHRITRPAEAMAAFAVLTKASAAEIGARLERGALAESIRGETCGDETSCAAVRATVADVHATTLETREVAEWGMPTGEGLDSMTGSLTAAERRELPSLARVVLVTARSPVTREALAARAGFAVTSALAVALRGLVYDETLHRIEDPRAFASHAVTSPLGSSAWSGDRVRIEIYEQSDGTARLLTLGMVRFGAPDLEVEGASMSAGHAMGTLVNELAARLADGATLAPIALGDGDGDVNGNGNGGGGGDSDAPPLVDLIAAPHHEGDPDNVVLRIVPVGSSASDPHAYDALVARAPGPIDAVVSSPDSPALEAIAQRARAALPGIVEAFTRDRANGATLLVKLPFETTPADGGSRDAAPREWMWVSVAKADDAGIEGALANTPVYVEDLRAGSPVTGSRADVADYVFDPGDGGKQGGDSIRALGAAP